MLRVLFIEGLCLSQLSMQQAIIESDCSSSLKVNSMHFGV